jgi:hypothetical protein
VYLGEARGGKSVNPHGHEAIITLAEFDAAQAARSVLPTPKNALASRALLKGLARCAGCGHTLKITGTHLAAVGRVPTYYCHGRYAKGLCPARATIISTKLDPYVEAAVLTALDTDGGPLAQAVAASDQVEEARRAVDEAEHELDLYLQSNLLSVIGPETFRRGVETRQQQLETARTTLAELHQQAEFADELVSGDLLEAWPSLAIQEKRLLLHGLLDKVIVSRAAGRGRNAPPLEERVTIVLRGGTTLDPP